MDNEQSLGLFMKSMSFIFMFFFTYKYSIVSTAAEPSRLHICRYSYTTLLTKVDDKTSIPGLGNCLGRKQL